MERELNKIFSQGPVVVFRWANEPGWPVGFVTPNVADILGYTAQDFYDKALPYEALVHPEDLPRVQQEVAEHSQSGAVNFQHEPYRLLARNGETIHVSDLTHIVRREDKGIDHYIGYICDISDSVARCAAYHRELQQSQNSYQTIFEYAPIGIFHSTQEGRFLQLNQALADMLGYDSPEDVLRNVDSIPRQLYPQPKKRKEIVQKAMEKEDFLRMEQRFYRKDGDTFYANLYLKAMWDEDGNFVYLLGIIEDISKRKQKEAELQQQKEKYLSLFYNAPFSYQSLDSSGRILEINPAWSQVTGYSEEEALGREFVAFLVEGDREVFVENFAQAQKGQKLPAKEYRLLTRSGQEIVVLFQGCATFSSSGRFIHTNCMFYDITQQRQAEMELARSEQKLREIFDNMSNGCAILDVRQNGDQFVFKDFNSAACAIDGVTKEQVIGKEIREAFPMVEEFGLFGVMKEVYRTGEPKLHPVSLYQDNRLSGWRENYIFRLSTGEIISFYKDMTSLKRKEQELEQSNATKDKFFSIIAHDLRGPLSGLLQLTEFMMQSLDEYSTEEIYKMLKSMHTSSAELNKLLNNLLDWSRLQRGKIAPKFGKITVDELVQSVVNLNQETLKAKDLEAEIQLVPYSANDEITVTADEQMLHAIMRNLLNNAIKFSYQKGKIRICAEENEKSVVISVTDYGTGIPQKKQQSLFELDNQTQDVGTAGETGTGLGLVLCQEYVQRHSGRIWLDSREGEGSTFFVELPHSGNEGGSA